MPHPIVEKIRRAIEPAINGAGYELVALEWKREISGWVCRVFIDRLEGVEGGAVGIADCERVSRELSPVLDVTGVIEQAYSLEVSSPGLDRPLCTAAHFRRFIGKKARAKLFNGVDGRRNFSGTIVAVPEGEPAQVVIEVDGQRFALPLADLEKANLVYEVEQEPTPGTPGKGGKKSKTRAQGAGA
jgi:ribosome maturation factor RimP